VGFYIFGSKNIIWEVKRLRPYFLNNCVELAKIILHGKLFYS